MTGSIYYKNFQFLWQGREELSNSMRWWKNHFPISASKVLSLSMKAIKITFTLYEWVKKNFHFLWQAEAKVFQSDSRQSLVNQDDWPWPALSSMMRMRMIIMMMLMINQDFWPFQKLVKQQLLSLQYWIAGHGSCLIPAGVPRNKYVSEIYPFFQ